MNKFLCVCLSSTIQRTVHFENLTLTKVNRSQKYRMDASGKAVNSARVLNQLEEGCVKAICPLGQNNKDLFLDLARKDNLKIEWIEIPGFTRECWTLLDTKNETTTELVVGEPAVEFDVEKKEDELRLLIEHSINEVDGVLLAGSRPIYWSEELVKKIAQLCIENNKFFLADYHGKDLLNTLSVCTPSAIKINDDEFISTFGYDSALSDEQFKNAVAKKSLELSTIVIVTRGTKTTLAAAAGQVKEYPVEKVVPLNTTACGDSFSAGILYEYVKTQDLDAAIKKGTWCASRNAERDAPGTIV